MLALWSHPLWLALVSLVVLGWLVWLPRQDVPARSLALFRCLLPSWRFFEQVELVPELHYRAAPHGGDWSDWQDALIVPPRTLGSLCLNAAGNLHLACQSLVEHLVAELEDAAELGAAQAAQGVQAAQTVEVVEVVPQELVAYRLVCALIEQRLRPALLASPRLRYQFRLVDAERAATPLFVSRVHDSK